MKKTYDVTGKNCGSERRVDIHGSVAGNRIDWLEDRAKSVEIISGRERLDGQWGWQCTCGSDDLLSKQEASSFSNPSQPTPQEIQQVVSNLKVEQLLFTMKEL